MMRGAAAKLSLYKLLSMLPPLASRWHVNIGQQPSALLQTAFSSWLLSGFHGSNMEEHGYCKTGFICQ